MATEDLYLHRILRQRMQHKQLARELHTLAPVSSVSGHTTSVSFLGVHIIESSWTV